MKTLAAFCSPLENKLLCENDEAVRDGQSQKRCFSAFFFFTKTSFFSIWRRWVVRGREGVGGGNGVVEFCVSSHPPSPPQCLEYAPWGDFLCVFFSLFPVLCSSFCFFFLVLVVRTGVVGRFYSLVLFLAVRPFVERVEIVPRDIPRPNSSSVFRSVRYVSPSLSLTNSFCCASRCRLPGGAGVRHEQGGSSVLVGWGVHSINICYLFAIYPRVKAGEHGKLGCPPRADKK